MRRRIRREKEKRLEEKIKLEGERVEKRRRKKMRKWEKIENENVTKKWWWNNKYKNKK